MRLPTEAQLSKEQKEVCYAPTERTILVVGPPGSGKTVVAVFRQNALKKSRKRVQALVYNKVLRQYTGIDETFYTWIGRWWSQATHSRLPAAPRGSGSLYDFEAAADVVDQKRPALRQSGNWGHVILDEAQDFSPQAHQFLCAIREGVFGDLDDDEKPSMTILADENQRINSANSTVDEIRRAHLLKDDQCYELRRNYRNTREIARLAACFYTGLSSGIPQLPRESGDRPRLVVTESLADAVVRIVTHVKNNPKHDVGVLVFYTSTRKRLFNRLTTRLHDTKVRVQSYSSDADDGSNDVSQLQFDNGGSVTVLCFASAKGLEFDSVFLPELQTIPVNTDDAVTNLKTNLYVMCSRARRQLFLMASDSERRSPIWGHLPLNVNVLLDESVSLEKSQ